MNVPLPMREPEMSGLQLCPVCRGKMRRTAEVCPHCGAQKHFGATPKEALIGTGAGLGVGGLLVIAVRGDLLIGGVALAVGAILGFVLAQNRYGDRWLPKKKSD
ncbi:hypothetical protein [Acetobacter sp. DsW_063]|uniref:hypothetical protein n=1 Tax=Acetobacter sp. DsW_063 TaxID=1514894 RepID=UPI001177466F|nr:hypothetical protein [Acetobacter sp. DsW_063]